MFRILHQNKEKDFFVYETDSYFLDRSAMIRWAGHKCRFFNTDIFHVILHNHKWIAFWWIPNDQFHKKILSIIQS